jgi:hypothetical protein
LAVSSCLLISLLASFAGVVAKDFSLGLAVLKKNRLLGIY